MDLNEVPPKYQATIQDRCGSSRLGRKQYLDPGSGCRLPGLPRIEPIRERGHFHWLSQNVAQNGATLRPFPFKLLPREVRHARGMRAGMACNKVHATSQLGDLRAVEEARLSDPICCDEEVAPPTVLFQLVSHTCVCPEFTVVKGHEYRNVPAPFPIAVNRRDRDFRALLPDRQDVLVKVIAAELVKRLVPPKIAIRPIRHFVVGD